MSNPLFLKAALFYHDEGLNVIPVKEMGKAPAVEILGGTWEQYQTRFSTRDEVLHWWGNGYKKTFNIGLVHGKLPTGCHYITFDIDKDQGVFSQLIDKFPYLVKGRIEQSGSGQGFHIPLTIESLPELGGNKTWKTQAGVVNVRLNGCQTVAPPSVHPVTRKRYKFIQKGGIAHSQNINSVIEFLDDLYGVKPKELPQPKRPTQPIEGDNLLEAVRQVFPDVMSVFEHFGLTQQVKQERDGQIRLLGHGGLLVTEDREKWFDFEDNCGGGVFEAWGWIRLGSAYDKHKHFRQILLEMAEAGGIDLSQYQKKREPEQPKVEQPRRGFIWMPQYKVMWERVR